MKCYIFSFPLLEKIFQNRCLVSGTSTEINTWGKPSFSEWGQPHKHKVFGKLLTSSSWIAIFFFFFTAVEIPKPRAFLIKPEPWSVKTELDLTKNIGRDTLWKIHRRKHSVPLRFLLFWPKRQAALLWFCSVAPEQRHGHGHSMQHHRERSSPFLASLSSVFTFNLSSGKETGRCTC